MSEPRQAICMEMSLDTTGVGLQFGWGRYSENHQDGVNSDNQVDGLSHMVPPCQLYVGTAQQRNNGLCQH